MKNGGVRTQDLDYKSQPKKDCLEADSVRGVPKSILANVRR